MGKSTTTPTAKARRTKKESQETRPAIYPDICVNGIVIPREALKITVAKAKELLGWMEETEDNKFGSDYFLTDLNGVKVRLVNNSGNRPWNEGWSLQLAQDILTKFFELNGETAIVGKYGNLLSAQHRLIALVLAGQKWADKSEEGKHWRKLWPTEPYIESLLVMGIDESQRVKNTLDNVRPRDYSDILFSDPTFFTDKKPSERKILCRATAYAVQELWKRTGYSTDEYSVKRTHSGSMSFYAAHLKIRDCISHLYEENEGNRIGGIFGSLGYAAAQMYLMAQSSSTEEQVETYMTAKTRSESKISFDNYDKAEEFWASIGNSTDFDPVMKALASLSTDGEPAGRSEKLLVIQRAWDEFKANKPMKYETIKLGSDDYSTPDSDGVKYQIQYAAFGGIDLGDHHDKNKEEVVTPDQVEVAKAQIKKKHLSKMREEDSDDRRPEVDQEEEPTPPAPKPKVAKKAIGLEDRLKRIWEEHPGQTILFPSGDWYRCYGKDAVALSKLLKVRINSEKDPSGLFKFDFPAKDLEAVVAILKKDKREAKIMETEVND